MNIKIELYILLMIFAFLHELGHLLAGLLLGFKPKNIKVNPLGFHITFKTKIENCNRNLENKLYRNKAHLNKIVIFLAGPTVNFFFMLLCLFIEKDFIISKETIFYSNLILAIFNLLPIYPLDGGRILQEIIHIFLGKKVAQEKIKNISFITVIILTIFISILILYVHNITFLLILAYLWYLVIKNKKEYNIYTKAINTAKKIF